MPDASTTVDEDASSAVNGGVGGASLSGDESFSAGSCRGRNLLLAGEGCGLTLSRCEEPLRAGKSDCGLPEGSGFILSDARAFAAATGVDELLPPLCCSCDVPARWLLPPLRAALRAADAEPTRGSDIGAYGDLAAALPPRRSPGVPLLKGSATRGGGGDSASMPAMKPNGRALEPPPVRTGGGDALLPGRSE